MPYLGWKADIQAEFIRVPSYGFRPMDTMAGALIGPRRLLAVLVARAETGRGRMSATNLFAGTEDYTLPLRTHTRQLPA